MKLLAVLTYWLVVALWSIILAMLILFHRRNARVNGIIKHLLIIVGLDAIRNIIENSYFGLFFGAQLGMFPAAIAVSLSSPTHLILPKLTNVASGCVVLGVLLLRWLPQAVRERSVAEEHAQNLLELATTDSLTGLINRRQFTLLAEAELDRQGRYARPLSLLMIDIDHFKSINDRYGHGIGDQVLCLVAKLCSTQIRKTDTLARMGGEEFALLLIETDAVQATGFAERLRKTIEFSIINVGEQEIAVTVSVGITSVMRCISLSEILNQADKALYEAKGAGRNRVCIFTGPETRNIESLSSV